ncbi:AraC family transcriptional regulator [Anaerocolumna xylanovorans]|uniref:AraC-type DNA-binding protein n=1 Tax=Anaerocolumna xylanovorans DSM 12503 TaxID=1121345 RepID=A0A1M7XWZ7_9FIRM|nr:helix-turn-helix domain-containing protein [Anaerocolumna xylanovorans]SHO43355.1 AraC-type DNA-binding protein [Anaerocolumna xylanovorans DSM 12503]
MRLFKKGIFSKLFLNITLCVVLAILLTSIVLYSNFESILMHYEYQARAEQLNSQQGQVSKLSEVAVKIGNQIYHDMNITKLLYVKEPNVNDMSAAFGQLRTYRASIPYIESIYIYNKYNHYVYVEGGSDYSELTANGYEKLNEGFLDASAREVITNFKDYKPFKPIPRSYYSKTKKKTNYFYTFFMYDSYTNKPDTSGVLINFNTGYLLDSFKENLKNDSEYFIVDEKGNIVSEGSKFDMLKNYSTAGYINKIVAKGDKKGYFTDTVNGEKLFFVYSQRDKYGWQYVSLTKYKTMQESIQNIQVLTMIVSIVFVIFSILLAFWITRRLYHPIYEMETDIRELERERRNAKNILKRVYISDLLSSKEIPDKEYLRNYFRKINMELDFEKELQLLLIRIGRYKDVAERPDKELEHAIKFAVINVFTEVLGEEYTVHGTDMGENDVILFINTAVGIDRGQFIEKLGQAGTVVSGYFNITLSPVLSSDGRKPEQIMNLYRQVSEGVLHRVFFPKGSFIDAKLINTKEANEYEYPLSKEKQLMEALMAGKIAEAKEYFLFITEELKDYPISIFNMATARLVVTLNNTVNTLRKNSISGSFENADMVLMLHQLESKEEFLESFYSFFDKIGEELEKKKAARQESFYEQIKNYIYSHYQDPDFSVESLAGAMNKSVPYISRVYSQTNGTTIKDTISELRMDMAKQLLKGKNLSINEIAARVGFSSTSYFHKAFKKATGVTPKEYQEKG